MGYKKILVSIMLIGCAANANANTKSTFVGKISKLLSGPNYNKILYIQIDRQSGSLTNELANCDNPNWDYLVDISTENGKFYASMIMAAYMAGKTVDIQGYEDCSGNVEKLRHIVLQ